MVVDIVNRSEALNTAAAMSNVDVPVFVGSLEVEAERISSFSAEEAPNTIKKPKTENLSKNCEQQARKGRMNYENPRIIDVQNYRFQVIVPLNVGNILGAEDNGPAHKWLYIIRKTLNNRPGTSGYHTPCLALFLWKHVKNMKVSCVGRGLMGYFWNKVMAEEKLGCHRGTQEDKGFLALRPQKTTSPLRISFSMSKTSDPYFKKHCFIYLPLRMEKKRGHVFKGWNEGKIYFPPTYKYSENSDRYSGDDLHPKEKRLTPAW
ncbi:hypothetical protein F2Q70_00042077 [Brassica cretica]|uniref:Inositol polyphosphate-related phosphatase domain-containing protein n=1 Tax=Brassica cretica TaxID=69181 RepID=A0A8S9K674_BRACR|nr:hypothetical protein F2Q70_00042077 [Brassica cretica]